MFDFKQQSSIATQESATTDVVVSNFDGTVAYYEAEGKQVPAKIHVYGSRSAQFRRVEEDQRKRKLRPKSLTTGAIHKDNIEKAVACTARWEGIGHGEQVIQCTPENVRALYIGCPWVFEDVWEAINDEENFFANGSKPQ